MRRLVSLASLALATKVMMWPARTSHQATAPTVQNGDCRVIQVIHYGGNLICHERLESNVVGSANDMIGPSRVEAMNSKNCIVKK